MRKILIKEGGPELVYDLVREDGRLERLCPHGIGHTVGHLNRAELSDRYTWIHGCDGCCHAYQLMGANQDEKDDTETPSEGI